jgi:hypothetical protein
MSLFDLFVGVRMTTGHNAPYAWCSDPGSSWASGGVNALTTLRGSFNTDPELKVRFPPAMAEASPQVLRDFLASLTRAPLLGGGLQGKA